MVKEQPKIVKVVINDESTIVDVTVQTVTRSGFYLDRSQAKGLVIGEQVKLDGQLVSNTMSRVSPGRHSVRVGPSTYEINVERSEQE